MTTLEEQLESAFVELGITQTNQDSITSYLNILKRKDKETYEHSIRVGLLAEKIGRHMHLDDKALFFAGTLHDIGKALIDPEILKKTENFTEEDMKEMRKHPGYADQLLRGVHEFSAAIILRHHKFQENSYPEIIPDFRIPFSENTEVWINTYARILSLVDYYDAITIRINEKFGEKRKLRADEVKSILLMKNPDVRYLIEDFYNNKIFGEEEDKIKRPSFQDILYDAIWSEWDGKRNPKETRRYVSLACALEPLPEKIGCTTRSTNISPYLKLEYFIAGAINIGDSFEVLAQRVLETGKQPKLIYDLAYKAQEDCKKNRAGGRVNQGIIEALIPIVAAQMIFDPEYKLSVEDVLKKSKEVLQNTSFKDVQELIKMKKLAYKLCEYYNREIPEYNVETVYDYYTRDLQNSEKLTSIKHNEEFVLGFPTIKKMYDIIMNSDKKIFNRKVEEANTKIRKEDHKEVSVGLTADYTAAAIYLVLSHHPKDKVII